MRYFLGLAAGLAARTGASHHVFAHGTRKDQEELAKYLAERYSGKAILCKNGRSALTLVLKSYFKSGDKVLINGFTCFAVFEAVKAAGMVPVFVNINPKDLNFDEKALEKAAGAEGVKGIIVQNTLGNPVDMAKIEKLAAKYNLTIIEDLAHAAGIKYPDGREAGTVGAGVAFSFGKDKSVDTTSGGAAILHAPPLNEVALPFRKPKASDVLRARFYPMFGAMCRGLSYIHLSGVAMKILIKLHWVEKSADNRLDIEEKIPKFEAKLALEQFEKLKRAGEGPLREFYLVNNREEVLAKLKQAGYYFDGFWYEKPVSPSRYYKKVRFPEAECPNAVFVAEHIINFPTFYRKKELEKARAIIRPYLINIGEK